MTFDTGGISIKPSSGMGMMRGDMGGAACVVSSMLALAKLGYPGKVVGLTPLCENMPSGNAVKPGDVVTAMNGKSIEVRWCVRRVSGKLRSTLSFWYHVRVSYRIFRKGGETI